MVLAIDRAGFVGEDGETHQGLFDMALLNSVPDLTIYSPSTFSELKMIWATLFILIKGLWPCGIRAEPSANSPQIIRPPLTLSLIMAKRGQNCDRYLWPAVF